MTLKLSIGVPVYNQAGTIAQTLDSLLSQTDTPDEIVVSDNHSTDGTSEIVAQYAGRVRVVRPPQHLGMMANWNFCVSKMAGAWFSLLSGDDIALPNFVKVLRRGIGSDVGSVLIRGDWDVIDGKGVIMGTHRMLTVPPVARPPFTWADQLAGPKVCFAAFAARRSAWEQVGGFDENYRLFGDWAFWLVIAPLGNFVHEREVIAQYRDAARPALTRSRIAQRVADDFRIFTHAFPQLPDWDGGKEAIIKHSQGRFRALLDYLFCAGDTASLSEETWVQLEKMATLCGEKSLYLAWRKNPRRIAAPLSHRIVRAGINLLRPLILKMRSLRETR